jgi:hypothetical protein
MEENEMLTMELSTRGDHEMRGHIRSFEPNQVCFDRHQDDRPKLVIRQTVSIELNTIDRKDYRWQGVVRITLPGET